MSSPEDGSRTAIAEPQPPAASGHGSWRLYLLLVVMVTLWSLNFLVVKVVLREFTPILAGGLRFLVAGAVILPYYLYAKSPGSYVPEGNLRTAAKLVGLGLLGVGGNQLCFMLGIARTSVGHAALVIALTPALELINTICPALNLSIGNSACVKR